MSAADDRLEILIGKLLDGEISPAEQRLLERELERDGQARELLEQLQALHECSREVVTHDVLEAGADLGEVFERAWQQNKRSLWRRVVQADGPLRRVPQTLRIAFGEPRFAVGLAAGFLLGLSLHFVLVRGSGPVVETPSPPRIARAVSPGLDQPSGVAPVFETSVPREVMRKVDWYGFTDQAGNQWLIEGIREGMVKPAAYHGDL